jgi:hypothetical protein
VGQVAFLVILAAFGAGVVITRRLVPPLATTIEGRIVFWLVAILAGAAFGVIADDLWVGIRALTISTSSTVAAEPTETVVVNTVRNVLLEGSVPLGLALIAYLLGPTAADHPATETTSEFG